MSIRGPLLLFTLVTAAFGQSFPTYPITGQPSQTHGVFEPSLPTHFARAANIKIPDAAYPATHAPFSPPNIGMSHPTRRRATKRQCITPVPSAVQRACRPDPIHPELGPRPGTVTYIHKPGFNSKGIIMVLGGCPPGGLFQADLLKLSAR